LSSLWRRALRRKRRGIDRRRESETQRDECGAMHVPENQPTDRGHG
jgi:hypothetical protein